MTTYPGVTDVPRITFDLPPELEAHEPPEARGVDRDGVRLLVGRGARDPRIDHRIFTDLPEQLSPGDVLVVNRSGTLPAAVDIPASTSEPAGPPRAVHFSTLASNGDWLVELRRGDGPDPGGVAGERIRLPGAAELALLGRHTSRRLWRAAVSVPDVPAYLARHGRPIRYGYVPGRWPLADYQTAFASVPGSAEMPSAGRPFTAELVTRLVARGVLVVPITLHTGVASPEWHEPPFAEWFEVPGPTARVVDAARARGDRVVAVGTTVVRALESAVDAAGRIGAATGWTDLVVTPGRGVSTVTGLLTGFHEPEASHLLMLEAVAGRELVQRSYAEALAGGYLWHEFGDVNLLLP